MAIELVRDQQTQVPLPKHVTHRVFHECLKRGLLTMSYEAKFRIQPSMTVDVPMIDEAVAIITEVFDDMAETGYWRDV